MYIQASQSAAPYRIAMEYPCYCRCTDAFLGWSVTPGTQEYPDLAAARAALPEYEDGDDARPAIVDAFGRVVVADPEPLPAPSDDLLF